MMTDCIKREVIRNAILDMHCKADGDGYVWILRGDAIRRIDNLPSVECKKGKWEDNGLDAIGAFGCEYRLQRCSECGYEYSKAPSSLYFAFCPNCGAEMVGGR